MLIKSHKNLFGNEQYEGFCIDLIKKLSEMNDNFSVNFIKSIDNKSGSPHMYPNKTVWWDGMVGDIINGVSSYTFLYFLILIFCVLILNSFIESLDIAILYADLTGGEGMAFLGN